MVVARNKMRRAMQQGEKDKVRPGKVARTQARKDARREAQDLRRQANVVRRHMKALTPWQLSKLRRRGIELAA